MPCPPSPNRFFAALCVFLTLGFFVGSAHAAPITYTVKGLDGQVYSGNPLNDDGSCPFGRKANSGKLAELKKAMDAGDPDKCPVAIVKVPDASGNAREIMLPLATCHAYFKSVASQTADYFKETPIETAKIALCAYPYYDSFGQANGIRNDMLNMRLNGDAAVQETISKAAETTQTPIEGVTNNELRKEIEEKKKKEREAKLGCFSDSLGKIESYWANKAAVSCIMTGRTQIKEIYKGLKKDLMQMKDNCQAHFSRQIVGVSASVVAAANGVLCAVDFALYAAGTVVKIKEATDWIQKGCREGSLQSREVDDWRKTTLNALCQSAANYLERAFTQCIRVDVGFDLNLPKFKLLLQCPWNVNVSYRLGNRGFKCMQRGGITASFNQNGGIGVSGGQFGNFGGRRGMVSGSGGMEALFDGSCFDQGDVAARDGGNFKSLSGIKESSIPGLECGDLSTDPKYNTKIAGEKPLQSGVTQNGWVAGPNPAGTETINGTQITRCDYFQNGRRVRTAYVYGNGASCNNTLNAFKDANGKETNTACYKTGGYEPFDIPAVPDGCLYPRDCLDNAGNFSTALQGTGNCPANVQPQFSDANQYLFKRGGVGTNTEWRSCEGMNNALFDPAPACCDPQMQNCIEVNNDLVRKGQAAIPLCKCDQGTANNAPDPNKQDGSCLEGGFATCCASSLNKVMDARGNVLKDAQGRDLDGCTTAPNFTGGVNIGGLGLPQTEVCRGEAPTCLAANECGKFRAPDGTEKTICPDQVAISKPSPYMYLFVRPDAQIPSNPDGSNNPNAAQCCTTKWCNICPQHYANAYGLSLARATNISVKPYGRYSDHQYDRSINDAIIGQGWPFVGIEDEYGTLKYRVGRSALPVAVQVYYDWNGGNRKDGSGPLTFVNPELERGSYPHKSNNWRKPAQLVVSDGLMERWLPPSFDACNRLPGNAGKWTVGYLAQDRFGDGAMFGTPYYSRQGNDGEKDGEWRSEFNIPEPNEYPIEYYNRIVGAGQNTTIMGVSVPKLPPLELCDDVIKVCEPGAGSALTGNGSGVATGGTGGPGAGGCTPGIFTSCDLSEDANRDPVPVDPITTAPTAAASSTVTSGSSAITATPSVSTPSSSGIGALY